MAGENANNLSFMTSQCYMKVACPSDELFYVSLLSDSLTMQFIEEPLNENKAVRRFNKELASLSQVIPKSFLWIIRRKTDELKLGLIGIAQREIFNDSWELGIILSQGAINQGIAPEVIEGLADKVLGELGIDKLYGRIKHNNLISIAMVTSLGFKNYKNDDDYGYWILNKR